MNIVKGTFGEIRGKEVHSYTLKNDSGMEVTVITYGGAITQILTPDRDGTLENVVLGFDTLQEYIEHTHYFGSIAGRVAGRIGGASYSHQGETVHLTANEGSNHLHGGSTGFNSVIWEEEDMTTEDDRVSVTISHLSRDGEEGYPGNVKVYVTYTLTNEGRLHIDYKGETDRDTPLNLTNHSYFNLSGNAKSDILQHVLKMEADAYLPLTEENLPTGEVRPVEGTAFDFREGRTIQSGMERSHEVEIGYDHPFVLKKDGGILLLHEESGRIMTVETDQESVVLYTGNFLTGERLSGGNTARRHTGICLETQGYPDAVNHPGFPSIILKTGETYRASTTYTFTAATK
ncbi:galactose mutarotase [Rossellomorea aquimaris]|uniref:aldose epimerase family protein n=1 Tax=Rossellomorea aquimaris TaxID=189382 RepID=UPI001CD354F8|nr:aldose epimerase family protein [Rossellomorea aquimaris]MCA1055257.1 galactose mutarotase [Rossellomorea aquimaris]